MPALNFTLPQGLNPHPSPLGFGGNGTPGSGIGSPARQVGQSPAPAVAANPNDLSNPGGGEKFAADSASKFSNPGTMPSWFKEHGNFFSGPGTGDQYWNGVQGNFNGGSPAVSNNAQSAYEGWMNSTPANLDPYYSHAAQVTGQRLNNQFGARGQFNSSAATDSISQAMQGLGAEQANREADYGLQRQQGITGAARGADESALAGSQNKLNYLLGGGQLALGTGAQDTQRMSAGGNLAGNADTSELNRLLGGYGVESGAQNLRENRIGTGYDRTLGLGSLVSGLIGNNFSGLSQSDMALLDGMLGGHIASTSAAAGTQNADAERVARDNQQQTDNAMSMMKMFGGGKGGK